MDLTILIISNKDFSANINLEYLFQPLQTNDLDTSISMVKNLCTKVDTRIHIHPMVNPKIYRSWYLSYMKVTRSAMNMKLI